MICRVKDSCSSAARFIIKDLLVDEAHGGLSLVYNNRSCRTHLVELVERIGKPVAVEALDEETIRTAIRGEALSKRARRFARRRIMRDGSL